MEPKACRHKRGAVGYTAAGPVCACVFFRGPDQRAEISSALCCAEIAGVECGAVCYRAAEPVCADVFVPGLDLRVEIISA